jgi:ABC-2 type transport system permease protein
MYVGAVLAGMAQAVVDDRERFLMLKSMYVAPVHIPMYLVGRGIARCVTTTLSVVITIAFGVMFLDLQVSPTDVRWGMFLVVVVTGMAMLAMMGLTLASVVLVIVHHSWVVGEAVAAALYLFCGAVFPLEVLPWWLRPLGYLTPVTYWLELVRRSLVGRVASEYPTLAGFSDSQLMTLLALITLASGLIATATFRRCDHVARERGLIDRTTNY